MKSIEIASLALLVVPCLCLLGCSNSNANLKAEAPPPSTVEREQDLNLSQISHPEQFPLATATAFTDLAENLARQVAIRNATFTTTKKVELTA